MTETETEAATEAEVEAEVEAEAEAAAEAEEEAEAETREGMALPALILTQNWYIPNPNTNSTPKW